MRILALVREPKGIAIGIGFGLAKAGRETGLETGRRLP
jgi:hypothetical protein